MTQAAPNKLDIETAIHETMSVIFGLEELINETFVTVGARQAGDLQHYALTDRQVDARMALMSLAADKAVALRDMFQAYTVAERDQKAVKS